MFESVKSLSVSLDEILKRERCVRFVCLAAREFFADFSNITHSVNHLIHPIASDYNIEYSFGEIATHAASISCACAHM